MERLTQAEKRRQYLARAKQSAHAVASRTERQHKREADAERDANKAVYAMNVRELSRAANKTGVVQNSPVKQTVKQGPTMTQAGRGYEQDPKPHPEQTAIKRRVIEQSSRTVTLDKPLSAKLQKVTGPGTRAVIDQRDNRV